MIRFGSRTDLPAAGNRPCGEGGAAGDRRRDLCGRSRIGRGAAFGRTAVRRHRIRHRRRLRTQSLTRLMPNIITVLALCAGLTGIQLALLGQWRNAVLAVMVAALLDASDGRLARLLGSSTRFGAELDSRQEAHTSELPSLMRISY